MKEFKSRLRVCLCPYSMALNLRYHILQQERQESRQHGHYFHEIHQDVKCPLLAFKFFISLLNAIYLIYIWGSIDLQDCICFSPIESNLLKCVQYPITSLSPNLVMAPWKRSLTFSR